MPSDNQNPVPINPNSPNTGGYPSILNTPVNNTPLIATPVPSNVNSNPVTGGYGTANSILNGSTLHTTGNLQFPVYLNQNDSNAVPTDAGSFGPLASNGSVDLANAQAALLIANNPALSLAAQTGDGITINSTPASSVVGNDSSTPKTPKTITSTTNNNKNNNNNNNKKLHDLEVASGLPASTLVALASSTPYVNGQIITIDTFKINGNRNYYAARLDILVNGKNALGHNWLLEPPNGCLIDVDFYKSFIKWITVNKLLPALQKTTPAGKAGELVTGGLLGIDARMTGNMFQNPITGPAQNTHPLAVDSLIKIQPDMINKIENICNIIRTKSYLSLPPSAFGGLQTLLYKAQGAVQGLVQTLYNVYHGVLLMMQKFAIMVNGILNAINQTIYNWLNDALIPGLLDLICAILGATQSLLDDVAFFGQLFGGGDGLFNAINGIQTVINYAAEGLSYAYNPISLAGLIPGVNNVLAEINLLASNPEAFLGQMIPHIGFSHGAGNKAIQIANAIILHYGLEGQLGPLGPLLLTQGVAGNSSQWYRTGATGTGNFGNLACGNIVPNPGYFDPNDPLNFLDVNSNPYFGAAKTSLNSFVDNVKGLPKDIAPAAADVAAIPGNVVNSVSNIFNTNNP